MNWNDIIKIALSIIASVGGIGVIIITTVKYCSDIIADRLAKKYELQMNKELEYIKSNLDKKSYISKTRFDKEFQIYQELCKSILDLTFTTYNLFPTGLQYEPYDDNEKEELYRNRYNKACEAFNTANMTLMSNAAFISKEIYEQFKSLRDLCNTQIFMYPRYGDMGPRQKQVSESLENGAHECYRRTETIANSQTELIEKIRNYLSTLEVLPSEK